VEQHRAQLARKDRQRAHQADLASPEFQAASSAWEARFKAARPDLCDTIDTLEHALAQVPPGADVAYAIWGGCLTEPLGLTEPQTIITLSDTEAGAGDGVVSEPADAHWTPLMRGGWAAQALADIFTAMTAYEAAAGDLRPMPTQDLADAHPAESAAEVQLSAEDDAETAEAEDPAQRWAGIIPAEVMEQAQASVPGLA